VVVCHKLGGQVWRRKDKPVGVKEFEHIDCVGCSVGKKVPFKGLKVSRVSFFHYHACKEHLREVYRFLLFDVA
jgi:hypothetical protein